MLASIHPIYTWSKDLIFAGKTERVVLLVEYRGEIEQETGRRRKPRTAARDIELSVWLEPHVSLTEAHGGRAIEAGGRMYRFELANLRAGQRKMLALELTHGSMPAGVHDAVWVQWKFKQPSGERLRELPIEKLSLESCHHTGVLVPSSPGYVDKHLELLKSDETRELALRLRLSGREEEAREELKRRADSLLLLAARTGDPKLLTEAESMYKQSEFPGNARALKKHEQSRTSGIL